MTQQRRETRVKVRRLTIIFTVEEARVLDNAIERARAQILSLRPNPDHKLEPDDIPATLVALRKVLEAFDVAEAEEILKSHGRQPNGFE